MDKYEPIPNLPDVQLEQDMLQTWREERLFDQVVERQKDRPLFSFLDGPITANNPMGVHHAWGRTYKDLFCRYKFMRGYQLPWQSGFDCHGLWVEVEVEKAHGFKSKQDIEKFGLANFSNACKERVLKYATRIMEQSARLGQMNDWPESYFTMAPRNIEFIWHFLKKCHEQDMLYQGERVMPWCTRCGTSLSQHELADSYKEITTESVFFLCPLNKPGAFDFLVVWTTTPWTIPANQAVAVNPDVDYVQFGLPDTPMTFWCAKARFNDETFASNTDLEAKIIQTVKGSELLGLTYHAPYSKNVSAGWRGNPTYPIIPWTGVSSEEGTGFVHIAPGCGADDYTLGLKYNLPSPVPLDESGRYVEGYSPVLTGKTWEEANKAVADAMHLLGTWWSSRKHKHRYPHCWRCSKPLVFRKCKEWFLKSDPVRAKMKEEAAKVNWLPPHIGAHMQDWLNNMGDWCISRRRFWGLPLPFYTCEDGHFHVFDKEMYEKHSTSAHGLHNLAMGDAYHRPGIDMVQVACPTCNKPMQRVPDVGDCWLDAGAVPFSTKATGQAEFITEMREQVRLWFYSMLFMGVVENGQTPYLNVLTYDEMRDQKGEPLSKTKGNGIVFDDAADAVGADVMRWVFAMASLHQPLRFSYQRMEEEKRHLNVMWNCFKFFTNYANYQDLPPEPLTNLDRWMDSRLNDIINKCTAALDKYDPGLYMACLSTYVLDLSTWYIRLSRTRGGIEETLKKNLETLCVLMAPVMPFRADYLWRKLGHKESVHLQPWPVAGPVDDTLLDEMQKVRDVVSRGLAARNKAGIKVRQPLHSVFVGDVGIQYMDLIKSELNVKFACPGTPPWEMTEAPYVEIDGVVLITKVTDALRNEGYAREFVRAIQEERKVIGLNAGEDAVVFYSSDAKWLVDMLEYIQTKTHCVLTKQDTDGKTAKIGEEEIIFKVQRG